MKEVALSNMLANAAMAQKKISRDGKNDLQEILNFIEWVNAQDQDTVCLPDGRSFNDVIILDEFKEMIYPASVRYEANSRLHQQLLRRKECEFDPNYARYLNACAAFRGLFKKDINSAVTSLSSLRTIVNLSDVMDKISVDDRVRYIDKPFFPIHVIDGLKVLFNDEVYLNASEQRVIEDWVSCIRF